MLLSPEVARLIYALRSAGLYALHPSIEVLRKPLHKDIVTPSRAIYTEAHYAILCVVEISQVSIDKTKHNASSILPKVEPVLPDSAAKLRTIYRMAK